MDEFSNNRNTLKIHFFAENCDAACKNAHHPIGQVRVPIWRMRKTRALPQCSSSGHRRGS
jgi:hypothetical protein